MFRKNIETPGRIFRVMIAILLSIYAVWQRSWIAALLALFTFFEVYMSWCIIYQILGKDSCSIKKSESNEKSRK